MFIIAIVSSSRGANFSVMWHQIQAVLCMQMVVMLSLTRALSVEIKYRRVVVVCMLITVLLQSVV